MKAADCPHYAKPEAMPRAASCEECGETWALRACTACGHVGCCESHHGHDTRHAKSADHPVIREVSTDMSGFLWCYVCEDYLD